MKILYRYIGLAALFVIVLTSIAAMAQTQSDFTKTSISIGVVVEDLEKSLNFYTNVIGMVQVREFIVESDKSKRMGLSEGESFDIKVLKLENTENATELKLMTFGRKAKHPSPNYIPDDNGIRYITIFVKSMKPLLKRMQEHGVKPLGETPTMLDEVRQFVLMQDPDGNFVEFIGPE